MPWTFFYEPSPHPALLPATLVLLACWGLLAWLGARALPELRRSWTGEVAVDRAWALGLTAFALVLRLWWAPIGPEFGWLLRYGFTDGFSGTADVLKYGLGHRLLVRLCMPLLGGSFDALFPLHALFGALAVLPMIGLARAVGASAETSRWCGFALAVMPLLVRFGRTDSPFPVDALFALLSLWAVARYAREHDARWLWIAVPGLVTTAQMRLESVTVGGVALLLALALTPGFPWRRRETWIGAAAAIVLLLPHAWLMSGQLLFELSYRYDAFLDDRRPLTPAHYLVFNPTLQARMLILALPFGLLNREVSWKVRLWSLVVMVALGSILLTSHPGSTSYAVARYQLRSLPHAAFLGGLGMGWLASTFPSHAVRLALVAGCLASLPMAATPGIVTREHEFFRAHLAEVGSPCTLVTWVTDNDTTLRPPAHLSELYGHAHTWVDVTTFEERPEGCVVYWKSGTCTMHYLTPAVQRGDRAPECAQFEERWELEPIAEVELEPDPYGPMGLPNQRPGEPMPVGFYRVGARRTAP